MVACNFGSVFLGIETPDEESLAMTQKFQNTRDSLSDSVEIIARSGIRVMAGFIIGFDGEKAGAGQRIVNFVEKTAIPTALFSMLQALPDTALWHRLAKENRLRSQSVETAGSQTSLMNYIPTRPLEDIATEYGQPKKSIEKAAMDALQKHNWSGNIRELRNVVERLIILSGKSISGGDVENYVLPRK